MMKLICALGAVTLILIAVFAVSVLGGSTADKKQIQRVKIGTAPISKLAGTEKITNYVSPGRDGSIRSLGVDYTEDDPLTGKTIGTTTYDCQHLGRCTRQVDGDNNTQIVHFTWMVQSETVLGGDRGTAYEAWDPVLGDLAFKGPDGGTDVHPRLGSHVNYSGYVGLDVADDGRVVIANHQDEGVGYASTVWFDFSPLGGFFSPYQTRLPDTVMSRFAADTSQFMWPDIDYQVYGEDTVVHLLAQECLSETNERYLHYFRHVGGIWGVWDSLPHVVDTINSISYVVASSRVSPKVALVWLANPPLIPGDGESWERGLERVNDVYYQVSNNMGFQWGSKFNITGWDPAQPGWAAHTDVSALVTDDDILHVIWNARETEPDGSGGLGDFPHFYGSRLFHWAEGQSIRTIKDANWDLPTDGAWCYGGVWNEMSIVKMQISQCNEKLYALFVQFNDIHNGIDDDCFVRALYNNEYSGTANGELFLSVSADGGYTWDMARNLTNSYSSACDSSPLLGGTKECFSEMWPSMSRFGMEVTDGNFADVPVWNSSGSYPGEHYLDVLYIDDKYPGSCVLGYGAWTVNPVKWFRIPCIVPDSNAVLLVTPPYIGNPAWTKPGVQKDTTLKLENLGNIELNLASITVVEQSPYSGWLTYSPEITSISAGENNYDFMTLHMNTGGVITDNGVVAEGIVIFTSNSIGSPDTIAVSLIVADSVQWPEYATIHTRCKPVYVSNVARMGNNGQPGSNANDWGNLQFYDDCDTTNNATNGDDDIACYLYEAAPFILRIDGNDTLLSTAIFDANWLSTDGFRPQEGLTVDSSNGSYQYAYTGKYLTGDSLIALESKFWAPSGMYDCDFIVQEVRVYSNTDEGYDGLFIGEFMDWDIPADSGVENGSDWDASRQMMYCYGAEYGPDSIVNNDCIFADDRMGAFAYFGGYRKPHYNEDAYNNDSFPDVQGMWTAMNEDWVFPTNGFVPGLVYKKMVGFEGYERWQSTNPALEDSLYQDLHMVAVFGQFDLGKSDTLVFMKIFSTSKTGLSSLQGSIDLALDWIDEQGIFEWPPYTESNCCLAHGLAGDANSDGSINLIDILQTIQYVYQDPVGDPPNPDGCNALLDCNGDGPAFDNPTINLLDILATIQHVYQDPVGNPTLCCPPGCQVP